jgi:hypothetical protein
MGRLVASIIFLAAATWLLLHLLHGYGYRLGVDTDERKVISYDIACDSVLTLDFANEHKDDIKLQVNLRLGHMCVGLKPEAVVEVLGFEGQLYKIAVGPYDMWISSKSLSDSLRRR